MALAHHLAFDFEKAEKMYDEAFCCRVEDAAACRADRAARDGRRTPPTRSSPGDVYTSEGAEFVSHLFQGLLRVDRS